MSRKFKKLSLEYSYLEMEKNDVFEICDKMEIKIREFMRNNCPDAYKQFFSKNTQSTTVTTEDPDPNFMGSEESVQKPTKPKNKDLKLVYRKVVEKTHPDKIGDNSKSSLFSEAVEAYKNNDMGKLIDLAAKTQIDIPDLSEDSIYLLEDSIEKIKEEIKNKKETTAWGWYKAKDTIERVKIIEAILKTRGISWHSKD